MHTDMTYILIHMARVSVSGLCVFTTHSTFVRDICPILKRCLELISHNHIWKGEFLLVLLLWRWWRWWWCYFSNTLPFVYMYAGTCNLVTLLWFLALGTTVSYMYSVPHTRTNTLTWLLTCDTCSFYLRSYLFKLLSWWFGRVCFEHVEV